jgi:hypothetical protein
MRLFAVIAAGPSSYCWVANETLQEPEQVNWKQWKEEGVDPQLVDAFQKAYESA